MTENPCVDNKQEMVVWSITHAGPGLEWLSPAAIIRSGGLKPPLGFMAL
jgi:hypothetical protein